MSKQLRTLTPTHRLFKWWRLDTYWAPPTFHKPGLHVWVNRRPLRGSIRHFYFRWPLAAPPTATPEETE